MDKLLYLDYLHQYLSSYVKRMFDIELSLENLDKLFVYNGNERHQYPLYFIWMVPEYTDWYLDNDKQSYILLGENFAEHMQDLFAYNSFILSDLLSIVQVPERICSEELLYQAKLSLGSKVIHMLEGCQKFLWSFIYKLEAVKKEIGASFASI
ncbi:hypothetical protein LOZ80_25650 [Paenibacillus sp. HWE-109]|uniref:hypothetical protein n=1 Tax=Paenibacillus sp. HWE-109 TaxID=1306526 RepID=UPI001EDCC748|nr:hypothetical protein [Paenibacillus sp. HWE-109]UKS24966.1 hypothetical protein LOZ80_25650 [Paenibacillus sp. HWE-109]